MFNGLRNSRLGKYYSTVLVKYGTVAPILAAFVMFMVLATAEEFGVMQLVKETSMLAYVLVIVALSLAAVAVVYVACTKASSKSTSFIDLVLYVSSLVAIFDIVKLLIFAIAGIEVGTTRVILFVVEVVLLVALNIIRMSSVRPVAKTLYETKQANATFKSYFVALFSKYNPASIGFGAAVLLALLFLFDGASLTGSGVWAYIVMITLILMVATVLFNTAGRIRDKRINDIDAVLLATIVAAVLFIIPLCMNFSSFKLVAWIVSVVVLVSLAVLILKNTYVEEIKAPAAPNGNKGFKAYFSGLAQKYNVLLAAVVGVIGFVVIYGLIAIDVLHGTETETATGFLVAIDIAVVGLLVAMLIGARSNRIGARDFVLLALTVFAVLSLVPAIEFFSMLNLAWVVLLILFVCVTYAVRVKYAVAEEVKAKETYNPVKAFGKTEIVAAKDNVVKMFTPDKGSHYISAKESRRIARDNMRTMKEYEAMKKRKDVPESEYVTKMKDDRNIVEFENLHTYFFSDAGVVKAVNGVSFNIPQGSTVGVIGESGCGKSVTSLSLMQLVQAPKGQVMKGSEIRFKSTAYKEDENGQHIPIYEVKLDEEGNELKDENGNPVFVYAPKLDKKGKQVVDKKTGEPIIEKVQKRDQNGIPLFETEEKVYNVAKMPTEVMRKIRGREITMIFQEPMTSLNPIFTIGDQLDEVVLLHVPGATKESAKARTYEMLKLVGIIPENVYERYPHELSGGMRQRVMIAMALSCRPKLIIADEPTTALDVTIQAQILDLLRDIKEKINGSIMFITHDLGVIAEMADFVVVMYAGRVIEMGTAKEVFDNPMHPYTMGLQKSKPAVNKKVDRLYSIPGSVPNPINMPNYCYFRDRCDKRCKGCDGAYPEMIQVSPTHKVSCHLYAKEDVTDGN